LTVSLLTSRLPKFCSAFDICFHLELLQAACSLD